MILSLFSPIVCFKKWFPLGCADILSFKTTLKYYWAIIYFELLHNLSCFEHTHHLPNMPHACTKTYAHCLICISHKGCQSKLEVLSHFRLAEIDKKRNKPHLTEVTQAVQAQLHRPQLARPKRGETTEDIHREASSEILLRHRSGPVSISQNFGLPRLTVLSLKVCLFFVCVWKCERKAKCIRLGRVWMCEATVFKI